MTTTAAMRWLRAMNPVFRPRAMAEAQRSARGLIFGLVISLVAGIAPMVWLVSSGALDAAMADQYAAMGLSAGELALQQATMQAMLPFVLILSAALSVVMYGVLAYVQWRYMTRAIPIVLLGLMIYGIVANIGWRLMGALPGPDLPLWVDLISWPATILVSIIYTAALQGAIMLHGLKGQR